MNLRFALNHMTAPQLDLRSFFALARALGITDVEIRNDVAGQAILDTPPAAVRDMAAAAGVNILTINALQRFNDWSAARATEAATLASFARGCGAAALILVPTNDSSSLADGQRQASLRAALRALAPLLEDHNITGLVEPLGFKTCSLRSKREAVDAIVEAGGERVFRLTHDTFHHHLAGEPDLFPDQTGLVHISGVVDSAVGVAGMRDAHRVLVDARDRIGNLEQIDALRGAGYHGPFSFEPFAAELRTLADPARALRDSMEFIGAELASKAA